MDLVADLAAFLTGPRKLLAFTGAGLSTGSGIPDFRGPQGTWTKRQPVYFDEFCSSETKRVEYWDYKAELFEAFRDARPNPAHEGLAALERLGVLLAVVTQNIDGLHQAAGTSAGRLVEVHGTNRRVECLGCGALTDPEPAVAEFRRTGRAPLCECGGWMKFATISFGQALKPGVLESAARLAASCDAVMSLGSTLSVHPAASIPLIAVRRRVPYCIVNRGETDQDELATLRLEGDVAELLPAAVRHAFGPGACHAEP